MKIELRNTKVNLTFSEETTMFHADLYVDNKKVGYAENEGHGGSTNYNWISTNTSSREENQRIIEEAETYCKSLPPITTSFGNLGMNLENYIDEIIDTYVEKKEKEKFFKKIGKTMEKCLVYGNKKTSQCFSYGWKKFTIAQLLTVPQGRAAIVAGIKKIESNLKKDETIWNENIPADIWAEARK